MIAHIVFKDVNPYMYEITEDCRIYKNGEEIPMDDIIYHSTNGYDYVLLEQNHLENEEPKMKLYRLEFIMVSSFNPGLQNKWEWFKVNHIDGNIKNCHIDNLTWEEDVEEWKVIEYPECIKRNMYMVSSWGRVRSLNYDIIMKTRIDRDGYYRIALMGDNNNSKFHRHIQRLVGLNFIYNPDPVTLVTVNHIDGDKSNNHISNLEWHSWLLNNRHAMRVGLNTHKGNQRITSDEVNLVVDMLLDSKYKCSPTLIANAIDSTKHPLLNKTTITNIKMKQDTYCYRCTKYDLKNLKFNRVHEPLTTEEINLIARLLLSDEYGGNPSSVYSAIDHVKYPNITCKKIAHVKYGDYKRNDIKYDISTVKHNRRG